MEEWWPGVDVELEDFGELGDLGEWRERVGCVFEGLESPGAALFVDDGIDRSGDAGEQTHTEAISEAAEDVLTCLPGKAEGRDAVVANERREEGDGDKGEAEVFGDGRAHVGFVDEHGVEIGATGCFGAIAQDHACGIFDSFDGEAEGCEPLELSKALIETLQGAGRVVLGADETEFDSGGSNASFRVGDAEDDDLVTALLKLFCERGERVDVSRTRKAECAKPCHASRPCGEKCGP